MARKKKYTGLPVDCGHPEGSPTHKKVGLTCREALIECRDRSPELRPCPDNLTERGFWGWIERKECEYCQYGIWPEGAEKI